MSQPTFDPHRVRRYTSQDATEWMEWSGTALADVVNEDEAPEARLGAVGFTRAPKGSPSDFEFAYDEVLVVGERGVHRSQSRRRPDGQGW